MRPLDRASRERGGALLGALALLALAAALLAGAAQTGRSAMRSTQSNASAISSEGEAKVALSDFLASWSTADDSLAIGQARESSIGPRQISAAGLIAITRLRLLRISSTRYVLAVDLSIGSEGTIDARRRLLLIMQRRSPADTTAGSAPPIPVARWSVADLF